MNIIGIPNSKGDFWKGTRQHPGQRLENEAATNGHSYRFSGFTGLHSPHQQQFLINKGFLLPTP